MSSRSGRFHRKVLGARREHEIALQRARRLDRRRHALDGEVEIVDRVVGIAGMILDRAAGEPGGLGGEDRLGGAFGAVALALLEIGRDRQVGRRRHFAAVMDHRLEADRAVGQAAREGKAGAGGGERLEAQRGQQLGGADIPRVGDDEGAARLMQRAKCLALVHVRHSVLRSIAPSRKPRRRILSGDACADKRLTARIASGSRRKLLEARRNPGT